MKSLFRFITILSFSLLISGTGGSQVVYESDRTYSIYDFLDELANLKVISINSTVKPYSRIFIAEKLLEARKNAEHLNKRQKDEVNFYLHDYKLELSDTLVLENRIPILKNQKKLEFGYNPIGFTFQDFPLTFSLRPIFGVQYYINENGSVSCYSGGGKFFGYIGKHLGIYAAVTSRYQSQPLVNPQYFTEMDGYKWKVGSKGEVTNTEFIGGLTISWNWGDFGVYNDRIEWGDNYHGSNIISGKAPPFPFIRLHLHPAKWIEFSYIHGWLKSNVIDSNRSSFGENNYSIYYFHKYIAANLVTLLPWKSLAFSFGNSIIYSDNQINPIYLNPMLFYKSVDQTFGGLNSTNGQNNQMFFTISWRGIRYLVLYGDLFVDDFQMKAFLTKNQHNEMSAKAGLKLSGFPFKNISLTLEYSRTNPVTYLHYVDLITFYNDQYCLGNYLRENSQELFLCLDFNPFPRLKISTSYLFAEHGEEQTNLLVNTYTLPVLKNIVFRNNTFSFKGSYALLNGIGCFIEYMYSRNQGDLKYSPSKFYGNTNTLLFGIRIGN